MINDLLKKLSENQASGHNLDPETEMVELAKRVGSTYLAHCQIDPKAYLSLLELMLLAADQELNSLQQVERQNSARDQAFKLAVAFGTFADAVKYLKRFESDKKNINTKQPIHDACLYTLPEEKNWDVKLWRSLIGRNQPNSPQNHILDVLPLADKIEKYVKTNESLLVIEMQAWLKNIIIARYEAEVKAAQKESKPHFKDLSEEKIKRFLAGAGPKQARELLLHPNTPLSFIVKYAANLKYARANENPAAAELFINYKIKEVAFDEYLALKPQDDSYFIPDVVIKGSDIHPTYQQFKLSKLNPSDPRAAILGKLTSCCQSLGDAGREPAKHGITDPRGGFYVIEDSEIGQIVAQCWAWRDEKDNMVFDSVETQTDVKRHHEQAIKDIFMSLANTLIIQYAICRVLVGAGGNTPVNFGLRTPKPAQP